MFRSVQFSHSVVSDSLRPHEPQHTRLPCPSPTLGVHSNSCPSSWWWHPAISSSVFPFSCPQSFPASGSFPVSQLLVSGGQSFGASASTSVLSMNIPGWIPLGLTGLITLQSKGPLRVFSSTTIWKHHFFGAQPSLWSSSHIHTWPLEKTTGLTIWTFVGKVMSLLFNMLSRFVVALLPRSKSLLFHGCSHRPQWFWSQRK